MLYESEIMRLVGEHRNISALIDVFVGEAETAGKAGGGGGDAGDSTDDGKASFLVMEMATGGELFDRLVQRGPYSEAQAAGMLREIVDAVAYCHANGVVHFDLKPENILLASPAADDCDVRLVDFGSARRVASLEDERAIAKQLLGSGPTVAYSAPEVLAGHGASARADVFSLGVIMHLLLFGAHPFDPRNDADNETVERRILSTINQKGGARTPPPPTPPRRAGGTRPARGTRRTRGSPQSSGAAKRARASRTTTTGRPTRCSRGRSSRARA